MTTTRRGNIGVARAPRPRKNSRIAKRYAIPATDRDTMKYGPPLSPKLREQIVSATHNVAPSMYTLHAGVTFTLQFSRARPIARPRVRPRMSRHKLPLFQPL